MWISLSHNEDTALPIITLTTDFGNKTALWDDEGASLASARRAQIADISHEIMPQNVSEGSHHAVASSPVLPGRHGRTSRSTGVGTARRALAARIGDQFVGPETACSRRSSKTRRGQALRLFRDARQPEFWLRQLSRTFHGRDIFARRGGTWLDGVKLEVMGTLINDPVSRRWPNQRRSRAVQGPISSWATSRDLTTDLPGRM